MKQLTCKTFSVLFLVTASVTLMHAPPVLAQFPKFESRTIDPFVGDICYAVTVADVNNDQRIDIVAVSERSVVWYDNPEWKKRVVIEDQTERDNVCIAAADIDGDGQIDFALGAGWTKVGTLQWLSRTDSLEEPWKIYPIAQEPWSHRMRFADVLQTGKPQLVVSPLNKSTGDGVRLIAFEVPANPRLDRWRQTVLNHRLNRMHNHWHADLDSDGRTDTLAASQEGITLVRWMGSDSIQLNFSRGADGDSPQARGAGEVKYGQLAGGQNIIASIEPMHGNQAVVYTRNGPNRKWNRRVLDDTLRRGHAVWLADLDRDGSDEVVIGHSDPGPGPVKGPGVYVYDAELDAADGTVTGWTKHVIDEGGIATEDLVAADMNGDGWVDIVAGGRATHNVRLYLNGGR